MCRRERRAELAFRSAYLEASQFSSPVEGRRGGGGVYDQQSVPGLTDVDPDAPLVAALYLASSGRIVALGGNGGEGEGGGDNDDDCGSVGRETTPCRRFLAQSCFKPLSYAMAVEAGMSDVVDQSVGCRGDVPFGTFEKCPDGRALNPLINAGALVILEFLSRSYSVEEVGRWCRGLGGSADDDGSEAMPKSGGRTTSPKIPLFDPIAVAATEADSDRNRSLSRALAESGALGRDAPYGAEEAIDRSVRYYAAMDCLYVSCEEMARAAGAFALTRVSQRRPRRAEGCGRRALGLPSGPAQRSTLSSMLHCGMYERSGEWARDVGVPAKSGVSGAVWAVLPGIGGLCAHQPRIDAVGNSVQAMALLRGMAERFPAMSIFDVADDGDGDGNANTFSEALIGDGCTE